MQPITAADHVGADERRRRKVVTLPGPYGQRFRVGMAQQLRPNPIKLEYAANMPMATYCSKPLILRSIVAAGLVAAHMRGRLGHAFGAHMH